MATTDYRKLQAQIKKLQDRVEYIRRHQRGLAINEIVEAMGEHAITLEDLRAALLKKVAIVPKASSAPGKAAQRARQPAPPKYRSPETGDTWTGRGKPPRWLTAKEVAGTDRITFLIRQERQAAPPEIPRDPM